MISNQPGVGPEPSDGPGTPSSSLIAYPMEIFQTPLIDISQPLSGMELIPARIGHIPILIVQLAGEWAIESVVGVQTSPVHVRAGSDAAHSNFLSSTTTPSNADVNGAVVPSLTSLNTTGPGPVTFFPNTPVYFDITVPAAGTGGFSCLARLIIAVNWVTTDGALI